jgi:hypothetical protein
MNSKPKKFNSNQQKFQTQQQTAKFIQKSPHSGTRSTKRRGINYVKEEKKTIPVGQSKRAKEKGRLKRKRAKPTGRFGTKIGETRPQNAG